MDLMTVLRYLAINCGAVLTGLIFCWALQNLQPLDRTKKRPERVPLLIILTIFLTPVGAFLVSLILRSRTLLRDIKDAEL
ncbi:MAG: hypothetical protein HBSIN02_17490 [Bacteroidia bacterium]|nr:MAG: hypothetical protein HBSIN02_17490 [Bacteroidia bacterium]